MIVPIPLDGIGATLRPYIPPSWFHPRGIFKVLRRIKPKLPDVSGKLFLTFTIDPKLFDQDPEEGFKIARQKLRRMFYHLRKGAKWDGEEYKINAAYCVKLEFHANGWAHFHVVFLTRSYVPAGLLKKLWGLGRIDVRRINNYHFRYLLKYVTKGGSLPDWVLGLTRVRIWQSSRGFYTSNDVSVSKPRKEKQDDDSYRSERTIAQRLKRWSHLVLLKEGEDRYRQYYCWAPFDELLDKFVISLAVEGRYLGNGQILISDLTQLPIWLYKYGSKYGKSE